MQDAGVVHERFDAEDGAADLVAVLGFQDGADGGGSVGEGGVDFGDQEGPEVGEGVVG